MFISLLLSIIKIVYDLEIIYSNRIDSIWKSIQIHVAMNVTMNGDIYQSNWMNIDFSLLIIFDRFIIAS